VEGVRETSRPLSQDTSSDFEASSIGVLRRDPPPIASVGLSSSGNLSLDRQKRRSSVLSRYAEGGYFAASLFMVVAFLIVAGIAMVFSRSAPEKADSLIFFRHNQ
jgi:hypothetical protein